MKRTTTTTKPKAAPLVLKRETVRVLEDDALRQALGGAKAGSSTRLAMVEN